MTRKTKHIRLVLGMSAVMLAATPSFSIANAATTQSTAAQVMAVSKVVKPVFLNSKSYINLVDASLAPADNGQIAAFTLSIYNGGNTALDLSDYWFRLSNLSGGTYTLKTTDADSKITKVSPGTKAFITLYASVGENTKLSDLIFKLVKFDFNVTNYEKNIGSFKFPGNFTNVVSAGSYKVLYFDGTTVNSKVSSATIGASGDNNYVTVNFVYNNVGKKAVTLSKYKYYIMTSEGAMYQATSSESEDLTIAPLTRKEFQLTATVPASLKTKGWKLIVMDGSDANVTLPIGTYSLFFADQSTSVASDNFTYANAEGNYQFKLLQLQREPYDSQDILTARIRITNKSSVSADLPIITGYFYLDDKVKLDFKTVASNNQFGLNADGYVDVDVYAKIPSNYSFTNAKLIVNTKTSNDANAVATKIGELSGSASQATLPTYAVDKPYEITRDGSKMSGVLNAVNTYSTTTSKLFTVQMTLTNDEQRSINPVTLAAYFKNDNGDIFPATTNIGTGSVGPQNKALVTFTAAVPENYNTNNLRLIVGEGVSDTRYADANNKADGYVNAVVFNLPNEQRTLPVYKNVSLLPYSFTINTFTPTLDNDNVKVTIDYDLVKDTLYNVYPTDRKYTITIDGVNENDGTEYQYFSQDFTLEGDGENALQVGKDSTIVFTKSNPYKGVDASLRFKVRLYEVVNGAKKLIVERPLGYWFIDNDWTKDNNVSN